MNLGVFQKQPRERLSISIGYHKSLDEGDEITEVVEWTVEPEEGALEVSVALVSEKRVRIWFDKGVASDTPYKLTVIVRTKNGEQFEDEIFVVVYEI